ncbi:STE14 [Candida jiufengensis]|uniref:STE14 n=1 Tax=Candida jiufengensis TaxID=497108 RepID=UPI002224EE0D|nr:STE14 [Candida jiufengensis]KAI5956705.1 STE14 [Candida jiufengensis]
MGELLSRYDPTRNNLLIIGFKSFSIGVVFTTSTILEIYYQKHFALFLYLQFLCIFHSLEFLSTYLFNNSQVDDDSFILEDKEFHIITFASIIEYFISPFKIKFYIIGFPLLLLGQFIRFLSMFTAQESFNHYVQKQGKESHKLVTNGIYKYIRHPSYLGFFLWFIGIQIILGNIIMLIVGIIILWRFFKDRIKYEEEYLIKFFGDKYTNYRNSTSTWMFIK